MLTRSMGTGSSFKGTSERRNIFISLSLVDNNKRSNPYRQWFSVLVVERHALYRYVHTTVARDMSLAGRGMSGVSCSSK